MLKFGNGALKSASFLLYIHTDSLWISDIVAEALQRKGAQQNAASTLALRPSRAN
jgi:hypothetical protein